VTWLITFSDGSTETATGALRVHEGVLWITEKTNYGIRGEERAYPLTSLRKWERR